MKLRYYIYRWPNAISDIPVGDLDVMILRCRYDMEMVRGEIVEGIMWDSQNIVLPKHLCELLDNMDDVLAVEIGFLRYIEVEGSNEKLVLVALSWKNEWRERTYED